MRLELLLGPDGVLNGGLSPASRDSMPAADLIVLALALIVGGGMVAVLVWMTFFRGTAKRLSPTMRRRLEAQPIPAPIEEPPAELR